MPGPLTALVSSRWAPWLLLGLSIGGQIAVTLAGADPFAMIDLKVYVDGASHLSDGTLYDFFSEPEHLPFTYPVFSAAVFTLVSWLPWTALRILWQLGSLAAVAVIIHAALRLLGRAGRQAPHPVPHLRGILVAATAVALWLEPVRTNFNYGQINLFLAALLLTGAASTRTWYAGASVGLAAGIKLVPAITGLYYLLGRRFAVVAWSLAAFAATVVVSVIVLPGQTWRYFTELIFDPGRTGPVWSAINQSWRGGLARLAGHDVPTLWLVAVAVTVIVGVWATWRAVTAGDRLGGLIVTALIGLLISPISWSHHWVWVLPALVWLSAGPFRRTRTAIVLGIAWLIAGFSYLVPVLIVAQGGSDGPATRPAWQSLAGLIYVALGAATMVTIGVHNRTRLPTPRDGS